MYMCNEETQTKKIRCVGATTLDEYRRYIEKDAALARRFQPIIVTEPSVADSLAMLRGLKERYELHHGLRIADEALIAGKRCDEEERRRRKKERTLKKCFFIALYAFSRFAIRSVFDTSFFA